MDEMSQIWRANQHYAPPLFEPKCWEIGNLTRSKCENARSVWGFGDLRKRVRSSFPHGTLKIERFHHAAVDFGVAFVAQKSTFPACCCPLWGSFYFEACYPRQSVVTVAHFGSGYVLRLMLVADRFSKMCTFFFWSEPS